MAPRFSTIENIANKHFDYVILGGGTAGSVLATRLSENSNVTVLVLEAGSPHINDPLIETPILGSQQFENPEYDWGFKTVPQHELGGRQVTWNRGKGLGGSSNMNYLAWTRPGKEDIDGWSRYNVTGGITAFSPGKTYGKNLELKIQWKYTEKAWEKLGNPGWNWTNFIAYVKRAENFEMPSRAIIEREGLASDASWFGNQGPVPISYVTKVSGAEVLFRKTLNGLGIQTVTDPMNGQYAGTWCTPSILDGATSGRSSAFKSYLLPKLDRANLFVLPNAYVARLLLEAGGTLISAKSVEFQHKDQIYQVHASREVLLCAGALKSPQILELSGIGDASILKPLGIEVKLDLPAVGCNVQDHIQSTGLTFELRDDAPIETLDCLSDPEILKREADLYANGQPSLLGYAGSGLTFAPLHSISKRAKETILEQEANLAGKTNLPPGLKEQYALQLERLKNDQAPDVEIIPHPVHMDITVKPEHGKKYLSTFFIASTPWSRGTAHITSKDPHAQPVLQPNYLSEQIDLDLMVDAFKFTRNLINCEPLKSVIAKEVNPGPNVVTDDAIKAHIKATLGTMWHASSSLSMLRREKGGVVDSSLKVYGTANIRVCDISVVPLLVGVHTQTIAYGLGEIAADIIARQA